MLKLTYPRGDEDLEAEVLAAWNGRGAVRLLDRDGQAQAKLLERLSDRRLFDVESAEDAVTVCGALARELAMATPPRGVPRLSDFAADWVEELPRLAREIGYAGPPRVVAAAVATCQDLGPDQPDSLLHGDLHGRNVLASDRATWLAIDPQGLSGEVAFECLTPIRDRWTRLHQSASPVHRLRRQVQVFAEAAGADVDRTMRLDPGPSIAGGAPHRPKRPGRRSRTPPVGRRSTPGLKPTGYRVLRSAAQAEKG